jgi:long-subunit fatty acid transport protein
VTSLTNKHYLPLLFLLSAPVAHADLPLTVENLLSDKGKVRINLSATYANSERRGVDASDPLIVQTGPTSFVTIPTTVGENLTNTDALITSTGIRYGLTHKDEIYGRVSALAVDSRSINSTGDTFSATDSRFADAWLGINHEFRNNTDRAALIGFVEYQLAEKQADGTTAKGKSYLFGGTAYQTYDPLVLSITGAVQLNDNRQVAGTDFEPGNSLTLSPSVGFAVNDKVTLTSGINWRIQQASTRDGSVEGIRRTRTSLNLGMGYALGKTDTLNFSVRPQVSGEGDVQTSLNWIHHLKNL